MMTEEAKAARRAYKRKWSKENPEKIREYQARYWAKRAASETEQAAVGELPPIGSVGEPAGMNG